MSKIKISRDVLYLTRQICGLNESHDLDFLVKKPSLVSLSRELSDDLKGRNMEIPAEQIAEDIAKLLKEKYFQEPALN